MGPDERMELTEAVERLARIRAADEDTYQACMRVLQDLDRPLS